MPDRIEPFVISVDGAALDDLRDRLRRARWPEREPVGDWSQGVPPGYLQDLAGCSIFPKEVPRPSRRWAQRRFANIVYWNQPARGGHFAAGEQPGLFTREVRAVARSCARPARQP
jgi:epoxide hydrolase